MDSNHLIEVKAELQKHFEEFLIENNIPINANFSCITNTHTDKKPSMRYWKEKNILHCFSCGVVYDIFSLNSHINNAPKTGSGFIYENVKPLTTRYNIPFEVNKLTKRDLRFFNIKNAYKIAANLLVSEQYFLNKNTKARGWNENVCKSLQVGSIKDYRAFIERLVAESSMSETELSNIELDARYFGPDIITYTISNEYGEPIAFQARYINPGDAQKCRNTPKTFSYKSDLGNTIIEDNPLLPNGMPFFGIFDAIKNKSTRLDVFEGPGSTVTARCHNLTNTISLLRAKFTIETLEKLKSFGFTHVNLVLDNDNAGDKSVEKVIDNITPPSNLKLTITKLEFKEEDIKKGNKDPEDFIRCYTVSAYENLKPLDYFDFKLEKIKEALKEIDEYEHVIDPYLTEIAKVQNYIIQGKLIRTLANIISATKNLDKDDIHSSITKEVDRRMNNTEESTKSRVVKAIESTKSIPELIMLMESQVKQLTISEEAFSNKANLTKSSTTKLLDLIDNINNNQDSIGWITGMPNIDKLLVRIPKSDSNMIFYGDPHHGKSAVVLATALNMALTEANKNLSVLYWPLDDSFTLTALRMLSNLSGLRKEVIMGLSNGISDEEAKLLKDSKEKLHYLMQTNRLVIKDLSDVNNTYQVNKWILKTQEQYGNDVILVVDALNDMPIDVQGDYEKTNKIIEWMQNVTTQIGACVIGTAHTNKRTKQGGDKGSGEPHQSNIKGNNKIEFSAKIIASVYNELHDVGPDVTATGWYKNTRLMPALKVNFKKVKSFIGNKGVCWFKMDSDSIKIQATQESDIILKDQDPGMMIERDLNINDIDLSISKEEKIEELEEVL